VSSPLLDRAALLLKESGVACKGLSYLVVLTFDDRLIDEILEAVALCFVSWLVCIGHDVLLFFIELREYLVARLDLDGAPSIRPGAGHAPC